MKEYYVETSWGVPKGNKGLYTYALGFISIQVYNKFYWEYLTAKMENIQLQKIAVSYPYDPFEVFTSHLKIVNSNVPDFIRISMDKFESFRNNSKDGPFLSKSLFEVSCLPLWRKN